MTSNLQRARERKRRNRGMRRKAEKSEASRLGISVSELRRRKYEEVQEIINNPPSFWYSWGGRGW